MLSTASLEEFSEEIGEPGAAWEFLPSPIDAGSLKILYLLRKNKARYLLIVYKEQRIFN
jgi:hypothetical protein